MDFADCLKEGLLERIETKSDIVKKELEEAKYDLSRAESAIEDSDFKWATIKAYFSMFHAARAVLFSNGYRERRHFVVEIFLQDLNLKGKLEAKFVSAFNAAREAREDADYHYTYSQDSAEYLIEVCEEFLARMKKLVSLS